MGNRSSKSSLRNAIIYLNISAESVSVNDDKFWNQIWSEETYIAVEVIKGIRTQEIRMMRDGSPRNFSILTYKMVEMLCSTTGTLCNTQSQQTAVLNAIRILIKLIPCIFEDKAWCKFFLQNTLRSSQAGENEEPELVFPTKSNLERDFKSYLPSGSLKADCDSDRAATISPATENPKDSIHSPTLDSDTNLLEDLVLKSSNDDNIEPQTTGPTLHRALILSICDLLFCPEFTVTPRSDKYLSNIVDAPPEDLRSLPTCDYVWEPGVGFDSNVNSTTSYDKSRSELLKLLLACLSSTLYETPAESVSTRNPWIEIFTSNDNRHALPLFTSLLNTVFVFRISKLPFNHLLFEDTRKELVELSLQILIVTLDYQFDDEKLLSTDNSHDKKTNLFIEYFSRIHRSEDFIFLIRGFTALLNNRLEQGYLFDSAKHINFDQELLILFWKICNLNRKFINHILKTKDILDIVVPILHHLNENFQDSTKTGLIHIGVFNLLILSGERNFGVRLNKPYLANVLINLPAFTGSHADLMIIVFHKLILYGFNLNQLFDFLVTIILNISPYLKTLSILTSRCLIQLFEIFSSPYVILTEPNYHQLVVFLLEIFNNLVQYQFDGNANLVYTIISKREAFINLANLPTTSNGIQKVLGKLVKKKNRMVEKISIDQNQNEKCDRSNDNHTRNDLQMPNQPFNQRFGATISSDTSQAKQTLTTQSPKQEVSLVATPEICHVTQPIHPFEMDKGGVNDNHQDIEQEVQTLSFSFDDVLNQTEGSVPQASTSKPDITRTSGNQPAKDKEQVSLLDDEVKLDQVARASSSEPESSKWKPTPDRVRTYKQSLPLQTMLRTVEVLTPQLERFKEENQGQVDEIEMIRFLQNGTLVGLLPVPHPILIRKYRTNSGTTLWFRTCTWGIVYVRNTIWTDTFVKLVEIV